MNEHETLTWLHNLTNKLQERLAESARVRARLAHARREASQWPEVRHTCRSSGDVPELPYLRRSDDDTQAH
jgi:hypothetical protein